MIVQFIHKPKFSGTHAYPREKGSTAIDDDDDTNKPKMCLYKFEPCMWHMHSHFL